jgi:hypothetical protein
MLTPLRAALHQVITSPRGDSFAPLRIPKGLARRLNVTLGSPLASREELARRAKARARLAELRTSGEGSKPGSARAPAEAAPVLVYWEKNRNERELARITELLSAKGYSFQRLDVSGDTATIEFVTQRAKCEPEDLPVVFVADQVVGGYEALVRADVSGELKRLVRPEPEPERKPERKPA